MNLLKKLFDGMFKKENDQWRISKITHAETGEDRTDDIYPEQINNIVRILSAQVGEDMFLPYVKDGEGNAKEGMFRTTEVRNKEYANDNKTIVVTTGNSVYYLDAA